MMNLTLRSARLWMAIAVVLAGTIALVDLTVTGPRVTVLWRADVTPADRLAVERRYDLLNGEPDEDSPATRRYRLGDWSRENLAGLVQDPAIADTGYIDRAAFTAEDPEVRISIRPWVGSATEYVLTSMDVVRRPLWQLLQSPKLWLLLGGAVAVWAARATGLWARARRSVGAPAAIGFVVIAFAASRAVAYGAGVRFDASPLEWYWQFIDPVLLRDRLFESLLYSHTQPPLFNLFLGLNLKLFPASFSGAMYVEYMVLGLVTAIALYVLLTELGLSPLASALLTAVFAVLPATIVYENWLFYEYPTMTAMVIAAAALHRFLARDSVAAGVTFFAAAATAIYLRTTFQLVWLLVVMALLMLVKRPRLVITCCAVPVVIVVLLYAKNAVLFGAPLTSSWFGMHLTRATLSQTDKSALPALVADGSLQSISLVEPFSPLEAYAGHVPFAAPTGIPVLDMPRKTAGHQNFNALSYIAVSRAYLRDALWLIRNRPDRYRRSVMESLALYLSPSSDFAFVDANVQKLGGYNRFVTRHLVFGLAIRLVYFFVLGYGAVLLFRLLRDRQDPGPTAITIMFLSFTILYASALSCLTENGENQRQRFFLDPLALAVVAAGVPALVTWVGGLIRGARRALAGPMRLSDDLSDAHI